MSEAQMLWRPSAERVAATRLEAFRRLVAADVPGIDDSVALHRWSVTDPAAFWDRVWTFGDVIGDRGDVRSEEHTSELQSH